MYFIKGYMQDNTYITFNQLLFLFYLLSVFSSSIYFSQLW